MLFNAHPNEIDGKTKSGIEIEDDNENENEGERCGSEKKMSDMQRQVKH